MSIGFYADAWWMWIGFDDRVMLLELCGFRLELGMAWLTFSLDYKSISAHRV
jgi:hypothetical protein